MFDASFTTMSFDGKKMVSTGPRDVDGWSVETGVLGQQVNGNYVQLIRNESKTGSPLEFAHLSPTGDLVKWTTTLELVGEACCDKPSIAGVTTPCGMNSRVTVHKKGHIQWIGLARKDLGDGQTITPSEYWSESSSKFMLIGWIGFNSLTGEVAFFGENLTGNNPRSYDWTSPIPVPGGKGYDDVDGREAAKAKWAVTGVSCVACHDNMEPRTITPYMKQSRIGYRDAEAAKAFSLGELIPSSPRGENAPYRVVGSDFTSINADPIRSGRVITDAAVKSEGAKNCLTCHNLTSLQTGTVFATDAATLEGTTARSTWSKEVGRIHPWMQSSGGELSEESKVLLPDAWADLRAAIESPADDAPRIYTKAPAPESPRTAENRIADPNGPQGFGYSSIRDNRDTDSKEFTKEITVKWIYQNWFGQVPTRDDVRFDLAFKCVDLPNPSLPPKTEDFPSLAETKAALETEELIGETIFKNQGTMVIGNISYEGHERHTDPVPSSVSRKYQVSFPAQSGKRYLLRLAPKRFTFDQDEVLYSDVDHLIYVDVK